MLTIMEANPTEKVSLMVIQELVGEPVNSMGTIPTVWWGALRLISLWQIWIARIAHVLKKKLEALQATIAKIWYQLQLVLKAEWKRRCESNQSRGVGELQTGLDFTFDFGSNDDVFQIDGWKLTIRKTPSEPD